MDAEVLKVGDVLMVSNTKIAFAVVVDNIFYVRDNPYYDCMYFFDTRDTMSFMMTLTPEDFERHVITKIDV